MSLWVWLCIFLAGGVGTLARIGMGGSVQRLAGTTFPVGTLAVNLLGCLLFGMVWSAAEQRQWLSPVTRVILLNGFMGAFTTFSTFAFETEFLLEQGRSSTAMWNLLAQCGLGIGAVFVGMRIIRLF